MSQALLTDLYELTMVQSYLEHGKTGRAVFSITTRSLPGERNFLVCCGLESLIQFVTSLSFTREDIAYLQELGTFTPGFLSWLTDYSFTGDIYAIPEGRIVFENEPLVRIEGSMPELQILETIALNLIHHQTVIASKAARVFAVSEGKGLMDFGLRRAHGPHGGVHASRATYIAGFSGTSNVEAGRIYGIPVAGTMAHSYILVFGTEEEAFRSYIRTFPDQPVLLIDTYDTIHGAEIAARLAVEGLPISGVRIDSGDIASIVPQVRKILDEHGQNQIRIIVSGGVDERDMVIWAKEEIPIDSYGIGTRLLTSADIPYLDMTYKLVEYDGIPRMKTSTGKVTIPGRRNVYRQYREGIMDHDIIATEDAGCEGELLTRMVVRGGEQILPTPSLIEIRDVFMHDFELLPEHLKTLDTGRYPVQIM
jgi:nicotinate phosphoribosyltransferase